MKANLRNQLQIHVDNYYKLKEEHEKKKKKISAKTPRGKSKKI